MRPALFESLQYRNVSLIARFIIHEPDVISTEDKNVNMHVGFTMPSGSEKAK